MPQDSRNVQLTLLDRKPIPDSQKLRGGYYTPGLLAAYLADWLMDRGVKRVLEPSCGDGSLVEAVLRARVAARARARCEVVAVELSEVEIAKAQRRAAGVSAAGTELRWIRDDFFAAYAGLRMGPGFDAVIGNPPFIRFQHFPPESRDTAFGHLRAAGYHPTKLANVWAAFVQLSVELLRPGGRLAMVVPAELLQVKYAEELRGRITENFDRVTLVGFRKLVFPEIQQEVFLLLAEGKRATRGIACEVHTLEVDDGAELVRLEHLRDSIAHLPEKHTRAGMKWTALLLDEKSYESLDRVQRELGLPTLGHFADVDVGIVTGQNSFFVIDKETRSQLEAARLTVPIVGKTSALSSIRFLKSDFKAFSAKSRAYLLNLTGVPESGFPKPLKAYLKGGEAERVHLGYKCRIRRRWFDVPSVFVPDGFLYRQISGFPLLVENVAGASSTDTIHRVRLKGDISFAQLGASALNSLTLAWSEVCGRSYGGGVLELEPTEAEELPVPFSPDAELDIEYIETALRTGNPLKAIDHVDEALLVRKHGVSRKDVLTIRSAWTALRDRRRNRK